MATGNSATDNAAHATLVDMCIVENDLLSPLVEFHLREPLHLLTAGGAAIVIPAYRFLYVAAGVFGTTLPDSVNGLKGEALLQQGQEVANMDEQARMKWLATFAPF